MNLEPRDPSPESAADTEDSHKRPPAKNRRRQAFDGLIALAIGGLLVFLVYRHSKEIFAILYGPTAVVILLIMVAEFMILKSFDRTRLYRLENERLVKRRQNDLKAMRETDRLLCSLLQSRLPPSAAPTPAKTPPSSASSSMVIPDASTDAGADLPEETATQEREEKAEAGEPLPETRLSALTPEELQEIRRAMKQIRRRIT